jgi:hypothetical protein
MFIFLVVIDRDLLKIEEMYISFLILFLSVFLLLPENPDGILPAGCRLMNSMNNN